MIDFKGKDWKKQSTFVGGAIATFIVVFLIGFIDFGTVTYSKQGIKEQDGKKQDSPVVQKEVENPSWPATLDKKSYDERMLALVRYKTSTTTSLLYSSTTNVRIKSKAWPTAAPYPHGGAILPFYRILAFYGNLYSVHMGILGELPPDQMLQKLADTKAKWEAADPTTPVMPAVEYIAIVAQGDGGSDGMYRAVMPDSEIEKAYALAKRAGGIFIIDLQVGKSTIQRELPKFKKYLERSDVHLAIDPEFSMKSGDKPGDVVGTFDASDVNYVVNFLDGIVKDKQLPPKVLLVHRFTQNMVTHATAITPSADVQVIMNMDGWGPQANKIGTYNRFVVPEPVQFTGIKLFYKNDLKPPSTGLLTPKEVLGLDPVPIYVQYQ
jgi:hypothetical protein